MLLDILKTTFDKLENYGLMKSRACSSSTPTLELHFRPWQLRVGSGVLQQGYDCAKFFEIPSGLCLRPSFMEWAAHVSS